jgi:hypothetical protein
MWHSVCSAMPNSHVAEICFFLVVTSMFSRMVAFSFHNRRQLIGRNNGSMRHGQSRNVDRKQA